MAVILHFPSTFLVSTLRPPFYPAAARQTGGASGHTRKSLAPSRWRAQAVLLTAMGGGLMAPHTGVGVKVIHCFKTVKRFLARSARRGCGCVVYPIHWLPPPPPPPSVLCTTSSRSAQAGACGAVAAAALPPGGGGWTGMAVSEAGQVGGSLDRPAPSSALTPSC